MISDSSNNAHCLMWVASLLVTCGLGCGGTAEPYGQVSGNVTFQGAPVPNAVIVFEHGESELSILGEANDAGAYQARRSADMPGLPLGSYRVAVQPPLFYPGLGRIDASKTPPERPDIPHRYRDLATSGITLTVGAEGNHELNIDMQPARESP